MALASPFALGLWKLVVQVEHVHVFHGGVVLMQVHDLLLLIILPVMTTPVDYDSEPNAHSTQNNA